MDYIISHISSFEYWRLAGRDGGRIAIPPSRAKIPKTPPAPSTREAAPRHLSTPLHCLCASKQKNRPETGVVAHWARNPLPPRAIRCISRRCGVVCPEIALLQMANKLTFAELVGIICEFCGRFSIHDEDLHGMFSREALTNVAKVKSTAEAAIGLQGAPALRVAARYALDESRSPAETAAVLLLTLPRKRGGYGLGGARLNQPIDLSAPAQSIAGVKKLRPDIMWPGTRICIEYDSDEFHNDERRRSNDARRKNAMLLSGMHVITLTKTQLGDRREMDKVAKHIARKTGKRWDPPDLQEHVNLRHELLGASSVLKSSRELLRRAGQNEPPFEGEPPEFNPCTRERRCR